MISQEGDFPENQAPGTIPGLESITEVESSFDNLAAWHAFESKYQNDLHNFRADVIQLFNKHGLGDMQEVTWMVFELDEEATGSGTVLLEPKMELLVVAYSVKDDKGLLKPYVHMSIKEAFQISSDADLTLHGFDFLMTDITVDEEDDALYFVDAYPVREDLEPEETILPLFLLHEGGVGFPIDKPPYRITPAINANPDDVNKPVYPFGMYGNSEDKAYALKFAQKILGQIKNLQPKATVLDNKEV